MPSKTLKRLVACQGSIQLITAMSVLSLREQEQQELDLEYEDYLIIYDLYSPPAQLDEFAAFVQQIAQLVNQWKRIVYLRPETIQSLIEDLKTWKRFNLPDTVQELTGLKAPDEIYLSRNYQFGNQLLINVYKFARKICYGDSIGIYFSESNFAPKSRVNSYSATKVNLIKSLLKKQIERLFPKVLFLKFIEFDIGYFSLPNAFGEKPPMPTTILDKRFILATLDKVNNFLSKEYIRSLTAKIGNAPISVLLTSNFSEAGRASEENEIAAYREFLKVRKTSNNAVLLIKPHPRDSRLKLEKLMNTVSEFYTNVFLLSEPTLFYLPFEVLLMQVLLQRDNKLQNLEVFTFSSACLSLELLFGVKCSLGFGSDIVSKQFYPDHASTRIKHETDLRSAIEEVRQLNLCRRQ